MKKTQIYPSIFSTIRLIGLLCLLFLFAQCHSINEKVDSQRNTKIENETTHLGSLNTTDQKQKGAHVFGRLDDKSLETFKGNNLNWITLVSYGDQQDFDSPSMEYYRGDSLENARRDSSWKAQIDLAHSYGFKVFLKPHIWLSAHSDGKWRSDIFPANEENWKRWKKNYREFILHYARIAEKNEVELFCVGTELSRLAVEKTDFWSSLIQEVRSVYSGELTYAANWYEEYEKINFWEELDYIGVQAYFPLAQNNYPSVQEVTEAWEQYLPAMESISKKHNRKILFSEMGYKSTADSAIEPWQWIENASDQKRIISQETQANCYKAFFDVVWKKDWLAGVHIWQMRSDYKAGRGYTDFNFTPQGKLAEKVIAKGFK